MNYYLANPVSKYLDEIQTLDIYSYRSIQELRFLEKKSF